MAKNCWVDWSMWNLLSQKFTGYVTLDIHMEISSAKVQELHDFIDAFGRQ